MTKNKLTWKKKKFLFPAVFHYYKDRMVVSRAKDQYVWDADGNQYLDFFGGIVTVSVGHCNETINAKLRKQMDTLQHVSTVFANEPQAALAKKIASITPEGKLTKSFFTSSGTEANETAIVAARRFTGSSEIVALRHCHQRRGADGLGTHRRQVVRHRAVRSHAGRDHQRQGIGQWIPHRPDGSEAGSRRRHEGRDHLHVRRQPHGRDGRESGARLH